MIDDDDDGNGDNDYDDENEEGRNYYRDKMTSDNGKAVGKFQERSQKEVEIPPTSTFALPNRFAENQSTRKSKVRKIKYQTRMHGYRTKGERLQN